MDAIDVFFIPGILEPQGILSVAGDPAKDAAVFWPRVGGDHAGLLVVDPAVDVGVAAPLYLDLKVADPFDVNVMVGTGLRQYQVAVLTGRPQEQGCDCDKGVCSHVLVLRLP